MKKHIPQLPEIKELLKRLGGPLAIGRRLGISHGAVCQWQKVPVEHVPALVEFSLERGEHVLPSEIRPDVRWSVLCEPRYTPHLVPAGGDNFSDD